MFLQKNRLSVGRRNVFAVFDALHERSNGHPKMHHAIATGCELGCALKLVRHPLKPLDGRPTFFGSSGEFSAIGACEHFTKRGGVARSVGELAWAKFVSGAFRRRHVSKVPFSAAFRSRLSVAK
jgi:hypothetical protein